MPTEAAVDPVSEHDLEHIKAQLAKQDSARLHLEGQRAKLEVVLAAELIAEAALVSPSKVVPADVEGDVDLDRDLQELQKRLSDVTEELRQADLRAAKLSTLQQEQEQSYHRDLSQIVGALGEGADIAGRIAGLRAARSAIEAVRGATAAASRATEAKVTALQAVSKSSVVVTIEDLAAAKSCQWNLLMLKSGYRGSTRIYSILPMLLLA